MSWVNYPRHFGEVGGALGAGEEVDHFPRSGVPKKKRRRDRLIRVAERHPEWAVGFLDECWWSRLARPALNSAGVMPENPCVWWGVVGRQRRSRPQGHLLLWVVFAGV